MPTSQPVGSAPPDLGISAPAWVVAVLTLLAAIAAYAVAYKPIGELANAMWRAASRLIDWRRSNSRRARRRALFADHIESTMRRLGEKEEWRDSRFAELEAEVEFERESTLGRLRRLVGGNRMASIRTEPSLTAALRGSRDRLIVLEGDPGAGKSVALRHLAQGMAAKAARRPSERSVLPIYVNLKTFRPPSDRPVNAEYVREFVLDSLNPAQSRDIDRFLDDEFDAGRLDGLLLFLFDSFDETPAILGAVEAGELIDQYADAISGFIGMGRSRGIIASREFRGPSRMGWPRYKVKPLSRKRRALLIRRADLDEAAENTLLDELGSLDVNVAQLAYNPLFLSLLCEYVRDERAVPRSVHAVLESYVGSRLTRDRERIERRFAITVEIARAFAEEMAFQMLLSPALGLSAGKGSVVRAVTGRLAMDPDEGLAAVDALVYSKLVRLDDSGESPHGPGEVQIAFSHRRLHEYFATCVAIKQRDRIGDEELLTNGRWRETAVAMLQTQRPEDSAALLDEAEAVLRKCMSERIESASAVAGDAAWPPGALHILDLLANGLKLERLDRSPAGDLAGEIFDNAWRLGNRLDRKWVVELCAAAGTERAIGYLTMAFDSESQWLRDQAYAGVRRIGAAADRLMPQIRQMLVDLSVGGDLRRERNSVRTQLKRLPNPAPMLRTVRLLLAAPLVAAVAGMALLGFFAVAGSGSHWVWTTWTIAAIGPVLNLVSVLGRRLELSSSGRVNHYSRRMLSRLGIRVTDVGEEAGEVFGASSNAALVMAPFPVFYLALFGLVDLFSTWTMVAMAGVIGWALCWPHGALLAAASGVWTGPRSALVLPLLFARYVASFVRRRFVFLFLVAGFAILASLPLTMLYNRIADRLWSEKKIIGIGLLVVYGLVLVWIGVRLGPKLWRRRRDAGIVAALGSPYEPDALGSFQAVLGQLRTDYGVQLLLRDVRKREFQRVPEIAEFLGFLIRRVEHGDAVPMSPAPNRVDWMRWWDDYQKGNWDDAPLLWPSSETLDELGRTLEDVRRATAFRS